VKNQLLGEAIFKQKTDFQAISIQTGFIFADLNPLPMPVFVALAILAQTLLSRRFAQKSLFYESSFPPVALFVRPRFPVFAE
jgi:hypothetical protein